MSKEEFVASVMMAAQTASISGSLFIKTGSVPACGVSRQTRTRVLRELVEAGYLKKIGNAYCATDPITRVLENAVIDVMTRWSRFEDAWKSRARQAVLDSWDGPKDPPAWRPEACGRSPRT